MERSSLHIISRLPESMAPSSSVWRPLLIATAVALIAARCSADPQDQELGDLDEIRSNISALWDEMSYLRQEVSNHHHGGHDEQDHDRIVMDVGVMQHEHHIHHEHGEEDARQAHPYHHLHHSHDALQHLDSDHSHDTRRPGVKTDEHDEHDLHVQPEDHAQHGDHDHGSHHDSKNDSNHDHGHDHGSDHGHDHGSGHGHDHSHDHGHGHSHDHGEGHSHDHDNSHENEHEHGDDHSHDHGHGNDHSHEHDDDHSHDHAHAHDHGHGHKHDHGHGHKHDHGHGHEHDPGHGHEHDHGHGHKHDHGHGHEHDPGHGHEHDHGHDHEHDHEHGHEHDHGHGHEHHHSHDHSHNRETTEGVNAANVNVTNDSSSNNSDEHRPPIRGHHNTEHHNHHDNHHIRFMEPSHHQHPRNQQDMARATCEVESNKGHNTSEVTGNITISQRKTGEGPVYFDLDLGGFDNAQEEPSLYGFHIHETAVTGGDCATAGGHFNPYGTVHGGSTDDVRHAGDLGNIEVATDGFLSGYIVVDYSVAFSGDNKIIGKSIVIHSSKDDLGRGGDAGSLATGNAGFRLACCNIRLAPEPRFRFGG